MWCSSHSSVVGSSSRPPRSPRSTPQRRRSGHPRPSRSIGCRPLGTGQSRYDRRPADPRPLIPQRSEKVCHAFVVESINFSPTRIPLAVLSSRDEYSVAYGTQFKIVWPPDASGKSAELWRRMAGCLFCPICCFNMQ